MKALKIYSYKLKRDLILKDQNHSRCNNIYNRHSCIQSGSINKAHLCKGQFGSINAKTLKTHTHFDLEILLLGIYTKEIIKDIHKDLGTSMFSTGCLGWYKDRNINGPKTGEWLKKYSTSIQNTMTAIKIILRRLGEIFLKYTV